MWMIGSDHDKKCSRRLQLNKKQKIKLKLLYKFSFSYFLEIKRDRTGWYILKSKNTSKIWK